MRGAGGIAGTVRVVGSVLLQVPDDEQHPAHPHPVGDPTVELQLWCRRVHIVRDHQGVRFLRGPSREISGDEIHTMLDAPGSHDPFGSVQGCPGDVDAGDLPPLLSQPGRFDPVPATSVQCRFGFTV